MKRRSEPLTAMLAALAVMGFAARGLAESNPIELFAPAIEEVFR